MQQFLRGFSEDGGAFRTIHDSQTGVVASEIGDFEKRDFEENSVEAKQVTRDYNGIGSVTRSTRGPQ